jgi:hypothetical protein
VDSAAEPFAETLRVVEDAKEAVVRALPTARRPGRPLAEALADFEDGLHQALALMAAWRRPRVEREWEACHSGLRAALRGAERLRVEAPDLSFDQLAFMIQDLIATLEAFEPAAERVRSVGG